MKPTSCDSETMLIVPCFNEANRLDLDAFGRFLDENQNFKIVFVDDGSTDQTADLILGYFGVTDQQVYVLRLQQNVGKAEAIRQGFLHGLSNERKTKPSFIGFLDADLATPLNEMIRATEIAQRRRDILLVIGTRLSLSGHRVQRSVSRQVLGKLFAMTASLTFGLQVRDTQCGAKLFRNVNRMHGIFDEPFIDRWLFDVEILARLKIATRLPSTASVFELPLESWREVEGSCLKSSDFLKAPFGFAKLAWHYRKVMRDAIGGRRRSLPALSQIAPEPVESAPHILAFTPDPPTSDASRKAA